MYVEKYMTQELITIAPETTVIKALDLMSANKIHRLPVIDQGQLVGLVTEGEIAKHSPSQATSLSVHELNYLLNKTTAQDMMIKDVITCRPETLLEEAASLMRNHNIGVLVVTENDEVRGIITDKDLFDAFIDVFGYTTPGLRVVVETTDDSPGFLERLSQTLAQIKANISQVIVFHENGTVQVVLHLYEGEGNQDLMRQTLEEAGYQVTSIAIKDHQN